MKKVKKGNNHKKLLITLSIIGLGILLVLGVLAYLYNYDTGVNTNGLNYIAAKPSTVSKVANVVQNTLGKTNAVASLDTEVPGYEVKVEMVFVGNGIVNLDVTYNVPESLISNTRIQNNQYRMDMSVSIDAMMQDFKTMTEAGMQGGVVGHQSQSNTDSRGYTTTGTITSYSDGSKSFTVTQTNSEGDSWTSSASSTGGEDSEATKASNKDDDSEIWADTEGGGRAIMIYFTFMESLVTTLEANTGSLASMKASTKTSVMTNLQGNLENNFINALAQNGLSSESSSITSIKITNIQMQ